MAFCPVCGHLFSRSTSGRPKEYCSSACREYHKYRNALERLVSEIQFDDAHKRRVRGDLFRMFNHLKFDDYGTKTHRKEKK